MKYVCIEFLMLDQALSVNKRAIKRTVFSVLIFISPLRTNNRKTSLHFQLITKRQDIEEQEHSLDECTSHITAKKLLLKPGTNTNVIHLHPKICFVIYSVH